MNHTNLALALTAMLLLALSGGAQAQSHPRPDIGNPEWQLDFQYHHPRAIAVEDTEGRRQWYWFIAYTVTNHTGEPRHFVPDVSVYYDSGQIVDADRSIPARVYRRIAQRLDNPLLETPAEVAGQILDGEDYARDSVTVWPAAEEHVRRMRVFFAGLSGETARLANPRTGEEEVLHRTRMLQYHLPGRPPSPARQAVRLEEERDVMR